MREAYTSLFAGEQDLTLCGQCGTAEEALKALDTDPCDLVVSDLQLPGMSGIDLLGHIRQRWPELPVLIVTAHDGSLLKRRAHEAGATAFLHKSEAPARLLETIRSVLAESASPMPSV